jgi:hypothetical protein
MFSDLLPDDEPYRVYIQSYAQRHFIKLFEKKHKGKIWFVTLESIKDDLRRVRALENTQQVDQLLHTDTYWLFKYDFAVALSGKSPKVSGNRCVVFLDSKTYRLDILLVYSKKNLPKNQSETSYILGIVEAEYPELWAQLH